MGAYFYITENNYKDYFIELLKACGYDWKYRSLQNLNELFLNAHLNLIDTLQYFIDETENKAERAKYFRYQKKIKKRTKFIFKDEEKLLVMLYNIILEGEGLGLLI